MSCYKKNKVEESGVHLTEKTCSPYNPIIKQIVDDCLGLPVYPVTSIDAVFDEDGNTLRKLLDELFSLIKSGGFSAEQLLGKIDELEDGINNLDNTYATGEDVSRISAGLTSLGDLVESLKTLLWAVSALTSTTVAGGDNFNPSRVYDDDGITPKIVKKIQELQSNLESIIGGSSGISLKSLQDAIDILEELLRAVAYFNTTYTVEVDGEDVTIPIIKEILDLKTLLGSDSSEQGTILDRLNSLERAVSSLNLRVGTLETNASKHAHLDPIVLLLMEGMSNPDTEVFLTLKAGEMPPTTIDMIRVHTTRRTNEERLEYIGLYLGNIDVTLNPIYKPIDVYPIGHSNSNGYALYKRIGEDEYLPIFKSGTNTQLHAGNSIVTIEDLEALVNLSLSQDKVAQLEEPSNITDIKYNELYIYTDGLYRLLGDIDNDGETKISDFNAAFNSYLHFTNLHSQEITSLPDTEPDLNNTGYWLYYYKEYESRPAAVYPCIEGKLYVDYFTGFMYRFLHGKMIRVLYDKVVSGTDNVEIEELVKPNNGEPYREIKISVSTPLETEYTPGKGIEVSNHEISISDNYLSENLGVQSDDTFLKLSKTYSSELNKEIISLNLDNNILKEEGLANINEYYIKPLSFNLILVKPDVASGNNPEILTILDVTEVLNIILNTVTTSIQEGNIAKVEIIKNILIEKAELASGELREQLLQLIVLIENVIASNDVTLLNSSENTGCQLYYRDNETDPWQTSQNITGDYYIRKANSIKCDVDEDGNATISDVTAILDLLLSGEDTPPRIYEKSDDEDLYFGMALILKKDENDTLITSNTPGAKTRLFRRNTGKDVWYYFDNEGVFRPLYRTFSLGYFQGVLTLYIDNSAVSNITLNDTVPSQQETESFGSTEVLPVFLGEVLPGGVSYEELDKKRIIYIREQTAEDEEKYNLTADDIILYEDLSNNYDLYSDLSALNISPVELYKFRAIDKILLEANAAIAEIGDVSDPNNEAAITEFYEKFEKNTFIYRYKCLDSLNNFETVEELTIEQRVVLSVAAIGEENNHPVVLPEHINLDILIAEIKSNKEVVPETTYHIKGMGVDVKFYKESTGYLPTIVNIEHRKAPSARINTYTDELDPSLTISEVSILPNEYVLMSTAVDKIKFNLNNLIHIPGYEMLEVKGTFVGKSGLDFEFIASTGYTITESTLNPAVIDNHIYEYTILNNRFSFKEI